eukprot:7326872-Prymnesium_polylepis.1
MVCACVVRGAWCVPACVRVRGAWCVPAWCASRACVVGRDYYCLCGGRGARGCGARGCAWAWVRCVWAWCVWAWCAWARCAWAWCAWVRCVWVRVGAVRAGAHSSPSSLVGAGAGAPPSGSARWISSAPKWEKA